MRRSVIVLGLSLALVTTAGCGGSLLPTTPAEVPSGTAPGATVFGALVPSAPEGLSEDVGLGRCFGHSADIACFSSATLPVRPVAFDDIPTDALLPGEQLPEPRFGARAVAPSAPTYLYGATFPGRGYSTIYLYWSYPRYGEAVTNYYVEAGYASGLSNAAAFLTGNTSTSFYSTVSGSGTVYVRVRAVGPGGTSGPSPEVVLRIVDPNLPGAPYGLSATTSGTTVTLRWYPPYTGGTPAQYVIQAADRAGGPPTLASFATGSAATTFVLTNVTGGTYYLRVAAANDAGVGPSSSEFILLVLNSGTCIGTPTPPSTLASAVIGSTVTLTWVGSAGGATSYNVEAGSTSGSANLGIVNTGTTTPTATFAGVSAGIYYVRVRGKNDCGTGAPSNEVQVVVR